MIPSFTSFQLCLILHLCQIAVAKRGGGGGDGGSVNTGGGSGGSGSSCGSLNWAPNPECREGSCICKFRDARKFVYELPGSYYNGTMAIKHQIMFSSAWTSSRPPGEACTNNDDQPKTYSYPGLLSVGANGNGTDTNPIFWALRGFRPPNAVPANNAYSDHWGVDVLDEWVHLRSSDWVLGNASSGYYKSADATGAQQQTQTYWDTKLTSTGSSSWDAEASLINLPPPLRSKSTGKVMTDGIRNSNYITLSNACYNNQNRYGGPYKNQFTNTTSPTVFLNRGVKAAIQGIGEDNVVFTMNATIQRQVVFVSDGFFCYSDSAQPGSWPSSLEVYQDDWASITRYRLNISDHEWLWNITATFSLTFRGSIVKENSSDINSVAGAKVPLWLDPYEPKRDDWGHYYDDGTTCAGPRTFGLSSTTLVAVALLWFIIL